MTLKFNAILQDAFFDEFEKLGESVSVKVPKSSKETPGNIKDNEKVNPTKNTDWKDIAKSVGWAAGGYAVGTGIGQGVSKLIPKNNPAVGKALTIGLPLVGVVGAEFGRKYREKLDREVWNKK